VNPGAGIRAWSGDRKAGDECEDLLRRVDFILNQLESDVDADVSDEKISDDIESLLGKDSSELLEKARGVLDEVGDAVDDVVKKRHDAERKVARLDMVSEALHLLDECNLSPAEFEGIRSLYAVLGLLPAGAMKRVEVELGDCTYSVASRSRGTAGDLILLVGSRDDAETFDKVLESAGLVRHTIDEQYRVDFQEGMELIEMDLWALRDELALINGRFNKRRGEWIARLREWRRVLGVQSVLLKAAGDLGAVGKSVVVLSGFMPRSKGEKILRGLEKRFSGRYFAECREAGEVEKKVKVPTKLRNWVIFRPFEMFVKNYGLPRYEDIDPTPFVAVSFLVMFGMMFGDVGHGAILALAGACAAFLPYNIFTPIRDLGKILMMSGMSGMVFGFLFCSIFGIESDAVLPALWMRPSEGENLSVFMGVALGIGIFIITLGIVLNIIQSLRQHNAAKALVGEWSVSSLLFFWMMLGLGAIYGMGHSLPLPVWLIVVIMAMPLVVIVVGQIMVQRYSKDGHDEEEHDMATLLFEPIEILMNLFTNSASFLRVAAFGLAHAALTMVTFILKDMVDSQVINFFNVPMQHLFIIVLEGMIVTIQCLRLEYYEFFSKFFNGDGDEFVPLVIDDN
jgi:V/A-type H+-transporting ATPase subunit I